MKRQGQLSTLHYLDVNVPQLLLDIQLNLESVDE